VFHVLNRGARRLSLFSRPADYELFERVLVEGARRVPMRTLAYCLMPNHWHLVLWPIRDDHLTRYMQWTTTTHALRWHLANGSIGTGAVYQGRFKAIPVQGDCHFLTLVRYVERNPVRAGMVSRAEDWPWSSAAAHRRSCVRPALDAWPISRPADWDCFVNATEPGDTLEPVRRCVRVGAPFGDQLWVGETARRLGLASRLSGRGRLPTADAVAPSVGAQAGNFSTAP
jgi:putative transposase